MVLERTTKLAKEYGSRIALFALIYSLTERIKISSYKKVTNFKIEYIKDIPVIKGTINLDLLKVEHTKIPIYLNPYDQGLSKDILIYGFREPLHICLLYRFIQIYKPRKILDIGSNIGFFPLLELHSGANQVIAIEPVPSTYKYLILNLARFGKKVKTFQVAIGTKDGISTIYVPKIDNKKLHYNLASMIPEALNTKYVIPIKVKTVSLDNIIKKYLPTMIRMDIEGYEWFLLKESECINMVDAIDMEVHNLPSINFNIIEQALKHLYKKGFKDVVLIKDRHPLRQLDYLIIKKIGLRKYIKLLEKYFGRHNIIFGMSAKVLNIKTFIKILKTYRTHDSFHTIILRNKKSYKIIKSLVDSLC